MHWEVQTAGVEPPFSAASIGTNRHRFLINLTTHKELAIVALGFSPNQQFKLFKSGNWQDLCPGTESLYA